MPLSHTHTHTHTQRILIPRALERKNHGIPVTKTRDEFSHYHGQDQNPDGTDLVSGSLKKKLINMRWVENKTIEQYLVNIHEWTHTPNTTWKVV